MWALLAALYECIGYIVSVRTTGSMAWWKLDMLQFVFWVVNASQQLNPERQAQKCTLPKVVILGIATGPSTLSNAEEILVYIWN